MARYYFFLVACTVAPLLHLTSSGSDAFKKVAVAHLYLAGRAGPSAALSRHGNLLIEN